MPLKFHTWNQAFKTWNLALPHVFWIFKIASLEWREENPLSLRDNQLAQRDLNINGSMAVAMISLGCNKKNHRNADRKYHQCPVGMSHAFVSPKKTWCINIHGGVRNLPGGRYQKLYYWCTKIPWGKCEILGQLWKTCVNHQSWSWTTKLSSTYPRSPICALLRRRRG